MFSHEEKQEKGPYLKKLSAPDFKIYIFGIVLQFLADWLNQNFWNILFPNRLVLMTHVANLRWRSLAIKVYCAFVGEIR